MTTFKSKKIWNQILKVLCAISTTLQPETNLNALRQLSFLNFRTCPNFGENCVGCSYGLSACICSCIRCRDFNHSGKTCEESTATRVNVTG